MGRPISIALLLLATAACGGGGGGGGDDASAPSGNASGPPPPEPEPLSDPVARPFVDGTAGSNLSYVVGFTLPFSDLLNDNPITFGGAAAGDCDTDGDVDLFITYGDAGPNRLYLNQLDRGNPLQFQDTAASAGVANSRSDGAGNDRHSGPTFADIDGDGDLDLFLGGLFSDPNKLYENRGDCTFVDITAGSGLDTLDADHTISAAFGDYDLDGDLDLFLTHWGSPDEFPAGGESEHLFRNITDTGGIKFENVSAAARVTEHLIAQRRFASTGDARTDTTYTPTFARITDDLWPDLAIAADYGTAQLLINDGLAPGTFLDATNDAVLSVEYGMGSALGDIDFDGDLDWFVTSIHMLSWQGAGSPPTGNRLYENPGGSFAEDRFINITDAAGVADGKWGWGACFADLDNDTDLDIYHTNGWEHATVDWSSAFIADGTGAFVDEGAALGLADLYDARGVVCADFDNDGDIDILQLTNDQENSPHLWRNDSAAAGRNFLRVQLIGLPPNTEAAGARIFATIGTTTQLREIMIGSNYTSQNPTVQVFGLGSATSVDELLIEWPALLPGPTQPEEWTRSNVPAGIAGQTLVVCHPDLMPLPEICDTP